MLVENRKNSENACQEEKWQQKIIEIWILCLEIPKDGIWRKLKLWKKKFWNPNLKCIRSQKKEKKHWEYDVWHGGQEGVEPGSYG